MYYLNTVSNIGILDLQDKNSIQDTSKSLSEVEIRSQEFVKELNDNLLSIDVQYNLRKWKYAEENYPSFE